MRRAAGARAAPVLARAAVLAMAACSAAGAGPPRAQAPPSTTPRPSAPPSAAPSSRPSAPPSAPPSPSAALGLAAGKRWLKGSTHVHARPSGDSTTPIPDVIAWYEAHGYAFIALTDHNQVSELPETVAAGGSTFGEPFVRNPDKGLIVLAGIELTHNPAACLPAPPLPEGKCRVHVNAIGVTARPEGKLEWAERKSSQRLDQYGRAVITARELGGLIQVNHPQWHWGMNAGLLTELGRRGARLVEVANAQFTAWNDGGGAAAMSFPSVEALWDAALVSGVTLWGVGSDDAHSYDGKGQYPAGGAWIMVQAERSPRAILEALAAGNFYASTGVVLAAAGRRGEALAVEVDGQSPGAHRIVFIEDGKRVEEVPGPRAQRSIPARGYVRAVVLREDGARAWVQPLRR